MTSFLVSHPHVASVSAGVAAALDRSGRLSRYYTGVAFNEADWTGGIGAALASRRPVLRNRIVPGVRAGAVRALAPVEVGTRVVSRILQAGGLSLSSYNALFVAHDAAVAALPWPNETTGIYAYEDGALRTFKRAARRDLERVLDVASLYYLTMAALWREEVRRWPDANAGTIPEEPPWKQQRKDGELALATKVSVASRFTSESLAASQVTAPIIVTPYGFPVDHFTARTSQPSGPFKVLSVGAQSLTKGTPYLLEAWKRAAIPDAELHLIGRMRLSDSFLSRYAGLYHHWPPVPKSELGRHYAAADVLVFPTLGDGFGLVIQEAMSCGTPVVTTPCGGGPECITDGADGWVVPPRDIDALVDRLRACAADRDATFRMGQRARARAEAWTWQDAGEALVRALEA